LSRFWKGSGCEVSPSSVPARFGKGMRMMLGEIKLRQKGKARDEGREKDGDGNDGRARKNMKDEYVERRRKTRRGDFFLRPPRSTDSNTAPI